jgi:hypothetical protein
VAARRGAGRRGLKSVDPDFSEKYFRKIGISPSQVGRLRGGGLFAAYPYISEMKFGKN